MPDTQLSVEHLHQLLGSDLLEFNGINDHVLPQESTPDTVAPLQGKDVFIEVLNRKILVKMPKNDADVKFLLSLRYCRWLKGDYRWEITDYPGNIQRYTHI